MRYASHLVAGLLACVVALPLAHGEQRRHFVFTYVATVTNIPADAARAQLWLPYPTSDDHQTIRNVRVDAPHPHGIARESEYGNQMLYVEASPPVGDSFTVGMEFEVIRKEQTTGVSGELGQGLRSRLLQPDVLVPISGPIAQHAVEATARAQSLPAKSRAIYDHVTRMMRYDKSGTGWGRGDALYACDAKAGNCTDFHSLIIGMARHAGIPALFEIGFPLPSNRTEGEVSGYHCWAKLYVDGTGWVPMDSSEASKHPERFDYFYGNLDEHRVLFSRGRDIVLEPAQAGPPVNYLIYPYAEVDGEVHDGIDRKFTFANVSDH